jgi:hypothetical protein
MSEASMPIFGRNVLILWQRLTLVAERVYGYNARSIFSGHPTRGNQRAKQQNQGPGGTH